MTAPPRPWRRKLGSDARAAYVFLAPALIGFTVFVVYPLIRSAYFALTQYNGLSDPKFVGFDNFRRMFTTDPSFWPSVRATLLLVVLYVPLSLAIGLALAVFCNQRMRGQPAAHAVLPARRTAGGRHDHAVEVRLQSPSRPGQPGAVMASPPDE